VALAKIGVNNRGSHILGYLVPGEYNDVRPGHRLSVGSTE
jgi:hypothetical protein